MRVLVITNDSTVFLYDRGKAKDIFGGRVTEVKKFCGRLSEICGTSLCIISGRYGLVSDETISRYDEITDTPERYLELQKQKDYASAVRNVSRKFDATVALVPKAMMAILADNDAFQKKVIAVTAPEFREEFERRGWSWYRRSGARIGKTNAAMIEDEIKGMCRSAAGESGHNV